MFCPSPTCALCQESSEGWTPSRCLRRSQVKAAGIPGRAPLPSMMSQRSGHATHMGRGSSSPSRRALQSPRRPACRPSGLWPVASACAAGTYPEDRTGHSLPALRAPRMHARTLPAGRRSGQARSASASGHAACHARMGGRTRWLLVRDETFPFQSAFAAAVSAAQARSDAVSQACQCPLPSGKWRCHAW